MPDVFLLLLAAIMAAFIGCMIFRSELARFFGLRVVAKRKLLSEPRPRSVSGSTDTTPTLRIASDPALTEQLDAIIERYGRHAPKTTHRAD